MQSVPGPRGRVANAQHRAAPCDTRERGGVWTVQRLQRLEDDDE